MSDSTPDEDFFDVRFPAFVLFSQEDHTPLTAETTDRRKAVALFTDLDSAETFVERADQKRAIIKPLPDDQQLKMFFSRFNGDDLVMIDPLGLDKWGTCYTVSQVLASVSHE